MMDRTRSRERPAAVVGSAFLMLILVGSQFMVSMDATIVNVALPSIQDALGFAGSDLSWVVNAYALPFGGLLLLGARLGDYLGGRRVFLAGTAVFTAASLWCGLATAPFELIAARALQGIGAAAMSPVAMSMLVAAFDGTKRHRALGLWGAMSGLAGGVGMVAGGLLTSVSWRWNFLVNVPIGVAIMVGGRMLPAHRTRSTARPDIAGAVLAAVGLSALAYAAAVAGGTGWVSMPTLLSVGLGIATLVAFVLWQRRAPAPLVNLDIFRNRSVSVGTIIIALTGAIGQITYFTYTLYLQRGHGFDPIASGMAFVPISIVLFAVSTRVQTLIARFGLQRSLCVGLILSAVGLAWSTRIDAENSVVTAFVGPSVIWAVGWGIAQAASFIAGAQGVSPDQAGTVSGLVSTSYRLGGAIGLAAMLSLAASTSATLQSGGYGGDLLDGLRWAWWGAAAVSIVGAVLCLALPRVRAVAPAA